MTAESAVNKLPNDIGGLPAGPISRVDHDLEPWEKRCHALADVLDYHKIINTEEKRCGVEALGADVISKLSYYERWIVAFANVLFRKGVLVPTDLAHKMQEVEARWNAIEVAAAVESEQPDLAGVQGKSAEHQQFGQNS